MKKSQYIIVAVIAILYLVITITISWVLENNKKYIFFVDGNNLKYDNGWSIVSNLQLPNRKYNLIKDGNFELKTKIEAKNKIFINNEQISGEIVGYSGNNIRYVQYDKKDINDSDYDLINIILSKNSISIDSKNILYIRKYEIDLNNDNIKEYVYSVSNNYNSDIGQLFSLVFITTGENYVIIEMDKFEDEFQTYLPYLYFLDVNNDKLSEIIVKNTYSSQIGQKTKIISLLKDLSNYRIIFEGE